MLGRARKIGPIALGLAFAAGCGTAFERAPAGSSSSAATTTTGTGGAGGDATGSATSTGTGGGGGQAPTPTTRVDLLIGIDNSRSMFDKQEVLTLAIPDLVAGLINPRCVDAEGAPATTQPLTYADPCPAGSAREMRPVVDLHIGVVTSSLGSHGADACTADLFSCGGQPNLSNDDHGRLVARGDACTGEVIATYQGEGFLAWDPQGAQVPSGENDPAKLSGDFQDMVLGAGQVGCGYESQLESWYRFLIEPNPHNEIQVIGTTATLLETDNLLLQQRADFLRPDSALAILMLSDENDCSVREGGQSYFVLQQSVNSVPTRMARARTECATNPADACCKPCSVDPGSCPPDEKCASSIYLTAEEDHPSLRCFDQKRRFGVDFLYPIDRYVDGLTSMTVADRDGNVVTNPLFLDLNPNDTATGVRSQDLVFLAGIVGVPWQDLARDPGDLKKGYKDAAELDVPGGNGLTTWDIVVGDPAAYVPPADPLMIESTEPRAGTNPATGAALAQPGSGAVNPINGSEYTTHSQDLQYACIFPLLTPRDCSALVTTSCDCQAPDSDNPLCAQDPITGSDTMQVKAKAYPGLRQLAVLRGLGAQGVPASICPAQIMDDTQPDHAYRQAVRSLIDRMRPHLQ